MMPILALPVWITLNFLSLEFVDEADYIVACVGKVLEVDYVVRAHNILLYCVELQEGEPRVSKLKLLGSGLDPREVLIDYEGEPIRCLHCLAFTHPGRLQAMVYPTFAKKKYK
jgi:hypothetical protein